jgi:hypothetical protein
MHVLAKKSPKTLFGFLNDTWDSLNHKLNFDPASFLACKDGCFLFPSTLGEGGLRPTFLVSICGLTSSFFLAPSRGVHCSPTQMLRPLAPLKFSCWGYSICCSTGRHFVIFFVMGYPWFESFLTRVIPLPWLPPCPGWCLTAQVQPLFTHTHTEVPGLSQVSSGCDTLALGCHTVASCAA